MRSFTGKFFLMLALCSLFLVITVKEGKSEVAYIYPSDDTWIASGVEANNPKGNVTELWVASAPVYTSYGLFKFTNFSSIPAGSIINSASIKIYCDSNNFTVSDYLDLCEVTSNWNESTVTWNSKPSYNSTEFKNVSVGSSIQYSWIPWTGTSVTELVKAWFNGSKPKYGFFLRAHISSTNNTYQFRSKEFGGGSYRPYIEVNYTTPKGNLDVYVKTQTGGSQSGAKVLLYTSSWGFIDAKSPTDANGKVSWTNIDAGTYHVEAYYPSAIVTGSDEFWGNAMNIVVPAGGTATATIQRYMPYAVSIETRDPATNQSKTQFLLGETLKIVTKVKNVTTSARNVKVQMQADRDKSGSMDFDQTTSYASVPAGATGYEFSLTNAVPNDPAYAGTYYVRPRQVLTANPSNGQDWLTDSWLWPSIAFTIALPTYTLSGTVTNNRITGWKEPVAGATVTINPSAKTTTTDVNGNYQFTGADKIPEGSYTVTASKGGFYRPQSHPVSITSDKKDDIEISPDVTIAGISLSKTSVQPGETVTITYTLNNAGSQLEMLWLGASHRKNGTSEWMQDSNYSQADHDKQVTVPVGTSTHVRNYTIPLGAVGGSYDLGTALWESRSGSTPPYDLLWRLDWRAENNKFNVKSDDIIQELYGNVVEGGDQINLFKNTYTIYGLRKPGAPLEQTIYLPFYGINPAARMGNFVAVTNLARLIYETWLFNKAIINLSDESKQVLIPIRDHYALDSWWGTTAETLIPGLKLFSKRKAERVTIGHMSLWGANEVFKGMATGGASLWSTVLN